MNRGRTAPSPDPSGSSWCSIRRLHTPVPLVHLFVSLAGPAPSDGASTPRLHEGPLAALTGTSRIRLPLSFTALLRQDSGEGLPPPLEQSAPHGARVRWNKPATSPCDICCFDNSHDHRGRGCPTSTPPISLPAQVRRAHNHCRWGRSDLMRQASVTGPMPKSFCVACGVSLLLAISLLFVTGPPARWITLISFTLPFATLLLTLLVRRLRRHN